jgi:hypothetical protein
LEIWKLLAISIRILGNIPFRITVDDPHLPWLKYTSSYYLTNHLLTSSWGGLLVQFVDWIRDRIAKTGFFDSGKSGRGLYSRFDEWTKLNILIIPSTFVVCLAQRSDEGSGGDVWGNST